MIAPPAPGGKRLGRRIKIRKFRAKNADFPITHSLKKT